MKNSNLLYIAIVGIAVFYLYNSNKRKALNLSTPQTPPQTPPLTRQDYASVIIQKGNSSAGSYGQIVNFSQDFLKNWADASISGAKTFQYQGKIYNTKGGRALRNETSSYQPNLLKR